MTTWMSTNRILSTWSNVRSERWLGRTEFRPKDYMRTFVGDDEFVQPKRNQTAPRSPRRRARKNRLTTPTLLEMDEKSAFRTSDPRRSALKNRISDKINS